MNTLEMLQALTENPKRKGQLVVNSNGRQLYDMELANNVVEVVDNMFVWQDGVPVILRTDSTTKWKIIEPPKKLKQMCFGEAYWHYWASGPYSCDFKSVLTGKDFRDAEDISKEEFMGLWTVEGIYEEDK